MNSMKAVLLSLILVIAIQLGAAMTLAQMRQATKLVRNTCLQRTGASKDSVEKMQIGEFSEDRKLKCYTKCVMSMMQSFKNNKLNPDGAMSIARKLLPDSHKERTVATIGQCREAATGVEDSCEMCFATVKCMYNADPEIFLFP
ncbi:general odorant-binding protein 72 [Bacillus rossius redtenbacheri]|uniref:general odorant-binding protein 72 n=1 Tax=Bacillus rossius redtenbacheri TaxID=93214 RepID=UPI002FDD1716